MSEKILIVDDDIDSLKLIGLMLQRHGYDVIAANTGNQAIAMTNSESPDVIILDVMMPDINGYEVCRRLRANPKTQPIPIIMFTAKTLIDDKVAGFEAGADDYLTKPTHPAELASRVKTILERSANQRTRNLDTSGMSIGILGAKGGLGVSTTVLNVGAAFRIMDESPIIADFRLGSGNLGLMMGVANPVGMANILSRPIEQINESLLEREIITHETGLRGLLSSSRPQEALMNYSVESAMSVVRGLRSLGKPVIYDLGNGYTNLIHRLRSEMDKLIVLVEPNIITLAMARNLLKVIGATEPKQMSVVVANRYPTNTQTAWHEIEAELDHEIRAVISAEPQLALEAGAAGVPIVNYNPNAIVSNQFLKLAEHLNTVNR